MIQRTLKAAKAAGKKAAIFCKFLGCSSLEIASANIYFSSGVDGADAQKRAQQGFDMVSIITDVGVLAQAMAQQLDIAKGKGIEGNKQRDGY
jgi:4-hydroxy-2-oxoheptanedioate aldolase